MEDTCCGREGSRMWYDVDLKRDKNYSLPFFWPSSYISLQKYLSYFPYSSCDVLFETVSTNEMKRLPWDRRLRSLGVLLPLFHMYFRFLPIVSKQSQTTHSVFFFTWRFDSFVHSNLKTKNTCRFILNKLLLFYSMLINNQNIGVLCNDYILFVIVHEHNKYDFI